MAPTPQTPPAAHELYEPSGMPPPPRNSLPGLSGMDYFTKTGQRIDFTKPGAWDLTGWTFDGQQRDTIEDGPLDDTTRRSLRDAYPDVHGWQVRPARIDETYRQSRQAASRISQLLGVDEHTAAAILTIATDDVLGWKFTWGRWEITGDDDDQSFRIRTVDAKPQPWPHAPGEGLEGAAG